MMTIQLYKQCYYEQASGWRILDQIFTLISQVEHQDLPEARYRSNNVEWRYELTSTI